jgi:hypothetical protein
MYAWEVVSVNFFIVRKPKAKNQAKKPKYFFLVFVVLFLFMFCGLWDITVV